MPVRIAKPAVNIREKLAELERPIGIKGSELIRSETTQNVRDLISSGRKNLVINGDLSIWQRGTSVNAPVDSFQWCADRFWIYNPNGSGTVQRSTDAPSGFLYSMHNNSTGPCSFGTNVELLTTGNSYPFVKNEWVTLSFYAKSSSNSSSAVSFSYRDTSTGNGSVQVASSFSRSFQYTTSWTKVIISIQIDVDPTANNKMFQFEFGLPPGAKVTGVQLEKGRNATDFEYRSIGEELALCQRYCYVIRGDFPSTQSGEVGIGEGVWNGTDGAYIVVKHPVQMRTNPSLDFGNAGWYRVVAEAVAWRGVSSMSLLTDSSSINQTIIYPRAVTDSRGLVARMTTQSTSAKFILSSEL